MRYFQSILPTFFVLLGNLIGGNWAFANMLFSLIFMVLVDFLSKPDHSDQTGQNSDIPNYALIFGSICHCFSVVSLIYGVSSGILDGNYIIWASISTGLNSGLIGITSAHELIHRKSIFLKFVGILNLVFCMYGHFFVEHRKGHHAFVGTLKDPATARKGESFYFFLLRTIPGQWISGLKIEMERLKRVHVRGLSYRNFVFNISLAEIGLVGLLFLFLGKGAAIAFCIQALIAIVLLEYVNYIEHYGLVRNTGERVGVQHAWQSDSATSRFTLFELSRHSHHHIDASVPYHQLQSLEKGNFLPFGYYGMFYIALIPPLWFSVMNKRLH